VPPLSIWILNNIGKLDWQNPGCFMGIKTSSRNLCEWACHNEINSPDVTHTVVGHHSITWCGTVIMNFAKDYVTHGLLSSPNFAYRIKFMEYNLGK
jgi:hypothetical protein